ncbi:MAG: DMT family transporter [Candidatus Polarisedimenticolaceae bacterium]|nr:DMT family transporter [Candidatus Polarisedimenticolaceae bacterium]
MTVPAAYLGVILIWTTTPLAIKWSGEGPGFLFGVTGRMVLSAVIALALVHLLRQPMPWNRRARKSYLAAGLGIYSAMLSVYWAAQFVPSGWISVFFGMTPIVSGVMAAVWLGERSLTPARVVGVLLGVAGLVIIFSGSLQGDDQMFYGVLALIVSVICHSASAVCMKRIAAPLTGLVTTAGGLLVAAPLFLLTWFLSGNTWPEQIGDRAVASIIYLSVCGSVLGFALYFYLLRHMDLVRVALITLITPVSALLLGALLNGEVMTTSVWVGTLLIMSGLVSFEFGAKLKWRPLRA